MTRRDQLGERIQRQLTRALEEADVLLVVCDAQQGIVPADAMMVESLRRRGKPMVLVANKAEDRLVVPADFHAFGLEATCAISALHGQGISRMLDRLFERLPAEQSDGREAPTRQLAGTAAMAVAIVGRPNVGKSSLFNALLREERVIVSDQPGTTRDAIDSHLLLDGEPVVLVDTAGLKHRRKVKESVEFFAMARSIAALERCDVALVVLDGTQGIVQDDKQLMERVALMGRGLVVLVNKWDVAKRVPRKALIDTVHQRLPMAHFAVVLPISAKTGFGVRASLRLARDVFSAMQGVSVEELAVRIRDAWTRRPPPRHRGRIVRCLDVRWLGGRPLRVQVVTSPAAALSAGYRRYLINQIASWPRMAGVPVQLQTIGVTRS